MKNVHLFAVICFLSLSLLSMKAQAQWVQTNGPYIGTVRCFAVSNTNFFAGAAGGGVFLSTNNGTDWTAVNSGLTENDVLSLAVSGTNLFVGTISGGVFLSTNNGTAWTAVDSGLTNTYVWALTVNGTNLFAGISDGVVWRRSLSEMITSVHDLSGVELPDRFSLEQNYPNPFNPSTTIRFSLPLEAHVTLKVFTVLGEEVSTLVSQNLKAGTYGVVWDARLNGKVGQASTAASGIYLYRLQYGQFSQTKKLILLR